MGGKTSTSTNQVSIPPEVLARYNSVNATAEQVAQTPFQQYSTNPNAFVQPLTPTQQAGIQNTNAAQGMAQPYYNAATGFALAGGQPINAQPLNTSAYMNPYLNTVLGSTEAMVNQQNQQAMSGQTGNAMSQGYFGGDRAGIAAAVLAGQQQLTGGQLYSGIASDAYNQAMAAAQQQQGVNLGAAQANRAALTGVGEQLAGLGTTAQGTALQGAQAQLGAGQVEQQTGQAGLTALYNQFLQQQSYPFQTAQFLANIAEGTGALSGSTTTSTAPQSIFSDERLKEDMVPVGVGFDGANIYRFRYRGDPTVHVGFSAQEVAQTHPEAVSVHPSGFLMVDYGKATADAAGFALAANDNWGDEPIARRARAAGGRLERQGGGMSEWGSYPSGTNPMVIAQILQAQAQMYGPYSQAGLYGGQGGASGGPYGGVQGHVPAASLPVGQLMIAHPAAQPQQGGLGSAIHDVASLADDAEGLKSDAHLAHQGYDWLTGHHGGGDGNYSEDEDVNASKNASGGRIGRAPGGLTAADYAAQAAQFRRQSQLQAAAAAAHAQIAQRQAADHYRATHPDTGIGARGSVLGMIPGVQGARAAIGMAPGVYHGIHQELDAEMQRRAAADRAAGASTMAGLGAAGNWLGNQPWLRPHGPGWKPTAPYVTDPNAYLPHPAAAAAAPPAAASAAPAPDRSSFFGPKADTMMRYYGGAPTRADLINHHRGQAQAHSDVAQQLAAGANQREDMPLVLNTGREPDPASTTPINVGDVSHLQTGFAPANLTPYHEGFFQRVGDWFGSHFGGDAGRMAQDAREIAPGAGPIQSEAFTHPATSPALVGAGPVQSEAFQARPPPTPPPDNVASSVDPALHPVPLSHDVTDPQLAARGGFARADGGAAANPWNAVVSGSSNLTGRASRQGGGELSNPQNDDPYHPQGPGLNIPTAETQHPKLATAQPAGGQQGGGLGSAIGMGSDLVNIAKFALPFFGVPVRTGGRIGYADGGLPADPDAITAENDPATAQVEEKYAPQVVTPRMLAVGASGREKPLVQAPSTPDTTAVSAAPAAAAAPDPNKQPGFGGAAQPPPPSQGGGGGFLGGLFHGVERLGEGVAGMAGYEGHGQWSRDKLFPLLSAIGAAGSVPTVHPFVALAAGLGGYGKAYMQQQQAEAQLDQTNAQAMQTHWQSLPPSVQRAVVPQAGPAIDPRTGQIDLRNSIPLGGGKYMHYGSAGDVVAAAYGSPSTPPGGGSASGAPQAGVSGSPGSAGAGVVTGPVTADYSGSGSPRYIIGPSSGTRQQIAAQYGINPTGSRLENEGRASATGPSDALRASAQKTADDYVAGSGQIGTDQANYRAMVDAASLLPDKGLGAVGPGQGERQLLWNAVNTWGKALIPGFTGFTDVDQNSSNTELLNKLSTINADALANHYGQRSLEAARDLKSVMPGGDLQKATIYEITSQMMIANERAQLFNEYRNNYQQLGLGDVGVLDAFNSDTSDMLAKQRQLLPKMMANGMFQYLEKNPSELKRVEQGYDTRDAKGNVIHVPGLGPGLGKLFQ